MSRAARDALLSKWAAAAVRDVLAQTSTGSDPPTVDGDARYLARESMTRLLRQVYAQGQRDAVEAMHAAVVPLPQVEPTEAGNS